jgi:drug/metabolite transporter (DMT)-like permease
MRAMSGWAEVAGRRPVLAAIAGALLSTPSATLVRLADVSPGTAAVFRCAGALPLLFALAAAERTRYGPRPSAARRQACFAGLCFAADLILFHHTIAAVGAGLATVLGNLQVAIVGLVAWAVLGERPERRLLIGVPVVMSGVVLLSGVVGAGAYGAAPALGAVLGIATSIAFAGFILFLRQGNRDPRRPAGPLADATLVAGIVSLPLGALFGGVDLTPPVPALGWLVLLAVSVQVVAWLLVSVSLPRLPAALPSLLLLIQPVGALWLGALLLGEAPSAVQLAGVAVVLAGVVYATAGRRRAPAGAG